MGHSQRDPRHGLNLLEFSDRPMVRVKQQTVQHEKRL
jgi:hypothetical protein